MDGSPLPSLDATLDGRGPFEAGTDGGAEAAVEADGPDSGTAPNDGSVPQAPFTLTVSGTRCLGDCPEYTLSLDETGRVSFVGKVCTARPGVFRAQIAQEDVQAVAAALTATDFATLRERYADQADGCTSVVVDGPTYTFELERDGATKTVTRSTGCQGAPDTARLDALQVALIERTGARPWLEGPLNCGAFQYIQMNLEASYLLHRGEEFIGRIALHWPAGDRNFANWWFDRCDQQSGRGGPMLVEPTRRILMESGDAALTLPVLGEVGSIVLSKPLMGTTVAARAFTNAGEVALSILESADCP